jgi:predicted P-loop ATPase
MGDRKLQIATAHSRKATRWQNKKVSWGRLCERCTQVVRTGETHGEYMAMSKDEQGRVKDVGGFVGGYLDGGVRKRESVRLRSVLTLDLDNKARGAWDAFKAKYGCAAMVYSTHKHTPESPRLRLVIPLARDVSPEEYEPIGRRVADDVGIEMFDPTTYEASRLMYWPSASTGAEFFHATQDGEWLDPDRVLNTYVDWQDVSEWPRSEHEGHIQSRERKKKGDPTEKPGVIGAFCRAYTIEDAIDTFLSDVYEPTATPGRYTYRSGTMAGGLVCYEGKFAQSFHATDPAGGTEQNAFDLVRIHLFGDRDTGTPGDITKAPSYKAMTAFAAKDGKTVELLASERAMSVEDDFGDMGGGRTAAYGEDTGSQEEGGSQGSRDGSRKEDMKWTRKLDVDRGGAPKSTSENAMLILENDKGLRGRLWRDEFRGNNMVDGGLPWRKRAEKWGNDDDANLRVYLERKYQMVGKEKIRDALTAVFTRHGRNPLREYLEALQWDGSERLDTLLIDRLGAEDSALVRAVTRMHFTAAVARAMTPGCKYDICLILAGPEGIGKSTLLKIMGGEWYNDTLSLAGMDGKQAMEQVKEDWIFELSELSGLKKSEVEPIKAFITKQEDKFRPAYGVVTESYPRHCVFCGTTNETAFLKGDTGNRRFIVIDVYGTGEPMAETFRLLEADRDQLWAEAVQRWRDGEKLYLPAELDAEARKTQEAHHENVDDPMTGMVESFLATPLPTDWETRSLTQRRNFYHDPDPLEASGTEPRTRACAAEFICEYLRRDMGDKEFKILARRFFSIMRQNKEWEAIALSRHVEFLYGRQKGFRRINLYSDDDL